MFVIEQNVANYVPPSPSSMTLERTEALLKRLCVS